MRGGCLPLLLMTLARPASAAPSPALDPDAIDRSARTAYETGTYAFCKDPPSPLGDARRLCALADEIDGCEGLREKCSDLSPPTERSWLDDGLKWAGPIATALLYLLVATIVLAIAVPVLRALLRLREKPRRAREAPSDRSAVAEVIETETPSAAADAEVLLRSADAHRAGGQLDRALALYLRASLTALDRRGAIRMQPHRTHGEYVRDCGESTARSRLRAIVREVDAVQFGGRAAMPEAVSRAEQHAKAIVRALSVAVAVLAFLGCTPRRAGADPAGDELPIEVLRKNGYRVEKLGSSLATMPIPDGAIGAPVVVVDAERVHLEAESRAHLRRWVDAGGVLVIFGSLEAWPVDPLPRADLATTRDLVVRTLDPNGEWEEEDPASLEVTGARVARPNALARIASAETVASLGGRPYAGRVLVGKGIVLGVANDDLFTNVGVLAPRNAAALLALLSSASHDLRRDISPDDPMRTELRVARPEDGVPPPANPFASLVAAGLGKGAWHALAASILLFLAYGIRHARARPSGHRPRRAFAEHVVASGAFYERFRADPRGDDIRSNELTRGGVRPRP